MILYDFDVFCMILMILHDFDDFCMILMVLQVFADFRHSGQVSRIVPGFLQSVLLIFAEFC